MDSDKTSIGTILLTMGAVTEEQIVDAMDEQVRLRKDALLGKILVANGSCTSSQLDIAISAQNSMRDKDRPTQALAIADLALARKRRNSLVQVRTRVIEKGFKVVDKLTRDDHKAITPAMLAENRKQ